jgi:uncharacterized protein YkwD
LNSWKSKWLTIAGGFILLSSLLWPAGESVTQAAVFRDTGNHWAKKTIEWAAAQGIVDGYEDGTFKPEALVSEPEFLAMLIRAFPEAGTVSGAAAGEAWYAGYYTFAKDRNWPLLLNPDAAQYNRGHVARLVAGVAGQRLSVDGAVQYLLDKGFSQGKTSATVEGYAAADPLTRAEAVQFLQNAKMRGLAVQALPEPPGLNGEQQVRGISLGDTEAFVLAELGQPARRDLSKYGFDWYIYNRDPLHYTQIGIRNGQVVGLFTSGKDWRVSADIKPEMSRSQIASVLGDPLAFILKGRTRFTLGSDGESDVYQLGKAYATFYYDTQDGDAVAGIQLIAEETEQGLAAFYSEPSLRLRDSYEQEIFDLANAARAARGLSPFVWNDQVARVARVHSEDMQASGYFEHTNPAGQEPWDRAVQAGIRYSGYAENIAAGQTDAFEAHFGWLNSRTGHRENLLDENMAELGVGVAFGGKLEVYYTQNFYTKR